MTCLSGFPVENKLMTKPRSDGLSIVRIDSWKHIHKKVNNNIFSRSSRTMNHRATLTILRLQVRLAQKAQVDLFCQGSFIEGCSHMTSYVFYLQFLNILRHCLQRKKPNCGNLAIGFPSIQLRFTQFS